MQVEDLLKLFRELREVHSRGDILASMSGHKFDMADGSLVSATGSLNIWLLRCNQSEKTTLYGTYYASLKRNLLGSKKFHKLALMKLFTLSLKDSNSWYKAVLANS